MELTVANEPLTVFLAREGLHEALEKMLNLFDKLPNVDAEDSLGRTALYWAIEKNNLQVIQLLLHANADVYKVINFSGYMALEIAAHEKPEIKQLFINSGYEFKKYNVVEKESLEVKKLFEKCGYSLESDELIEKAIQGLISNIIDRLFSSNDTEIAGLLTFFTGQKTNLLEASIKEIELTMTERYRLLSTHPIERVLTVIKEQLVAAKAYSLDKALVKQIIPKTYTSAFFAKQPSDENLYTILRSLLKEGQLKNEKLIDSLKEKGTSYFSSVANYVLSSFIRKIDMDSNLNLNYIHTYLEKTGIEPSESILQLVSEKGNIELKALLNEAALKKVSSIALG